MKLKMLAHFSVEDEQGHADTFLRDHGLIHSDITRGVDAWSVAHATGLMQRAYKLHVYNDAHIQTFLAKVFPNVIFAEAPRY
jgi:hypothetical protein